MISRRDGGEEMWLQARARAVEGMEGEPLYAVTSFEDVTSIKEAEFEQTLLAGLAQLFESAFDHGEMAARLTRLLIPQLADCCSVYAMDPGGTLEEVATRHADRGRGEQVHALLADLTLRLDRRPDPSQDRLAERPVILADLDELLRLAAADPHRRELFGATGMGSAMLLPMRIAGVVAGALLLINEADRRPFDEFDVALGQKVADRAAAALESARLASERSEIAATLQHGLLPPPIPDIPGWSVAALYRPAGAENAVGGDFYDAFRVEDGWILVVGDATGRGARAASITALARYTLRTASAITGDPLAAISALNRALLDREGPALCSVAALAIREKSSDVRIVVAGHPPPLIVDGSNVREAVGSGPVLGAFPDCSWDLETTRLEAGQHLVVYTDGVTEAAGPNGRFGEEQLRTRGCSASPAREWPSTRSRRRSTPSARATCRTTQRSSLSAPATPSLLDEELARLVDTARG